MPAVSQRMPSLSSAERHSSWATPAEKTAPAIGAATGGSGSRSDASRFRTLDAVTLTDGDFDKLRERLQCSQPCRRARGLMHARRAISRRPEVAAKEGLARPTGRREASPSRTSLRSPDAVPPEIDARLRAGSIPDSRAPGEHVRRCRRPDVVRRACRSGQRREGQALLRLNLPTHPNHGHLPGRPAR